MRAARRGPGTNYSLQKYPLGAQASQAVHGWRRLCLGASVVRRRGETGADRVRRLEHSQIEGGVGSSLLCGGTGRAARATTGAARGKERLLMTAHMFSVTDKTQPSAYSSRITVKHTLKPAAL